MAAHFEDYTEYASLGARHLTFRSFRVGCAVTQTIAGKDIAENIAAVNWKSEKFACRCMGGAATTRYPTGNSPGAAEAYYVAANALAASVDPAMWALFPPRSAPPRGVPQPPTACATSSPVPSQINIPRT